jgi:hypothetical protein
MTDDITRRDFVKQSVVGTAALTGASARLDALQSAAEGPTVSLRKQVIGALGALFIPSRAGDPG